MIFPGLGLELCCFYGCEKADCFNVLLAGILMSLTAPCIIGWVVSCVVGFRMIVKQ